MRNLDLATLQPSASYAGTWTDYAQDTAYGGYTLAPGAPEPVVTTAARYQPGAWERQGDALRVHHGDQIGSSRFMTNASVQPARRAVYAAFGELVLADHGLTILLSAALPAAVSHALLERRSARHVAHRAGDESLGGNGDTLTRRSS